MKTLRNIAVGETAKVKRLHGEGALKRRIMDMGITKGSQVYVRKVAPLGDPVHETTIQRIDCLCEKSDAWTVLRWSKERKGRE